MKNTSLDLAFHIQLAVVMILVELLVGEEHPFFIEEQTELQSAAEVAVVDKIIEVVMVAE